MVELIDELTLAWHLPADSRS